MGELIRYNAACHALAEARSVDEVKDIRDKAEAVRAYARQAKNKQLEIDAAEIRIRAEMRLGDMMQKMREAGMLAKGGLPYQSSSTGSKSDPVELTYGSMGIDKHLADRARKMAAVPTTEREIRLAEWREEVIESNERVRVDLEKRGGEVLSKKHFRIKYTGLEDCYTPEKYIQKARYVLGSIDLDPASSDEAQKVVQAGKYFTKDDDGLWQDWFGNVWLNPPYSQPSIQLFVEKLISEYAADKIASAIILTTNHTDTKWFSMLHAHASFVCFTTGRINFDRPGQPKGSPPQGQAFHYFAPKDTEKRYSPEFFEAFRDVGIIYGPCTY